MAEKSIIINLCDRCDYNESGGTRKSLPAGWMKLTKGIDLCPSCTTGFQNWMEMPKAVAAENQDAAANAGALPDGVDPVPTMPIADAMKSYLGRP